MSGSAPGPVPVEGVTTRRTPAAAAAERIVAERLREVRRLLRRAGGNGSKDARIVHQLRVSSRRASAALRVFGACVDDELARRSRQRLRSIRRAAARARSCDVLAGMLSVWRDGAAPNERAVIDRLLLRLGERRRRARGEIVRVAERWGRRELKQWQRDVVASCRGARGCQGSALSVGDLAPVVLGSLIDRVREAGAGAMSGTVESLHALRLAVKRLRYAIEVLAPALVPAAREDGASRLAEAQERLGEINDLHEVRTRLEAERLRAERRLEGAERGALVAGAGALIARVDARRVVAEASFARWLSGGELAGLLAALGRLVNDREGSVAAYSMDVTVRRVLPGEPVFNGSGS